jgi:hypothetical protein
MSNDSQFQRRGGVSAKPSQRRAVRRQPVNEAEGYTGNLFSEGDAVTWGIDIIRQGLIKRVLPDNTADVAETGTTHRTWRLSIPLLRRL